VGMSAGGRRIMPAPLSLLASQRALLRNFKGRTASASPDVGHCLHAALARRAHRPVPDDVLIVVDDLEATKRSSSNWASDSRASKRSKGPDPRIIKRSQR
jgi:hypothetical protein